MKKDLTLTALSTALVLLLVLLAVAVSLFSTNQNSLSPNAIRVACVGDSLTQSSEYPYDLWMLLGNESYTLRNFGAGATTVSLKSETPYMNTSVFHEALEFQPNIVIIMLGTNDAQPSLHQYNGSFVSDYAKLVSAFQALPNKPQIWIVLPPPVFSDQEGKISPEYFQQSIIPRIQQAANQTNMPTIDVYSVLAGHPEYSPDGVHVNSEGAKLFADTIYKAILAEK
jgi:acyl-CoA thioesterase I